MNKANDTSRSRTLTVIALTAILAATAIAPITAHAAPNASPLQRFYPTPLPISPTDRVEDAAVWLAKVQGLLASAPLLLQQSLLNAQSAREFASNVALLQQMQEGLLKQNALNMKHDMKRGRISAKAINDASNLAYQPLEPCRIMDTRAAVGGSGVQGPLAGGLLYNIPGFVSVDSSWQIYGGSASDCGLTSPPGTEIHAVAIVLTILNPNFDAFLGVSDASDLNAVLRNVALNYTHGQGLSTMYVIPQLATHSIYFAMPPQLSAELIFDVVGYFAVPDATALQCTQQTGLPTTIGAAGGTGNATSTACPAAYTLVGGSCDSDSADLNLASVEASPSNTAWFCSGINLGDSSAQLTATANCCRVPGK